MLYRRRYLLRTLVFILLACVTLIPREIFSAEEDDHGTASYYPWSGYWWPMHEGAIIGPLGQYDRATGQNAAAWERKYNPPGSEVPKWHGYCHAWAASAVMEQEPTNQRQVPGHEGSDVQLQVGDQKGMLAACHAMDVSNIYGDRYGDGIGSEAKEDIAPDLLWRLLKTYVKQQGVPLILDIEAGEQVWNYPVYAYRVSYRPQGEEGQQLAKLSLWMTDNAVPPDYVGRKIRRQTYEFTFKLRRGSVVMGSGQWTGRSQEDHPDFAWYPYVAVSENPEIEYAQVQTLLGQTPSLTPDSSIAAEQPENNSTDPADTSTPDSAEANRPEPTTPEPAPNASTGLEGNLSPTPTPDQRVAQNPQEGSTVISPMDLVAMIANKTSSFGLDVTVDRFDGGKYTVGERLTVRGSSERPGYLYLLQVDSKGGLRLLYPHPGEDNRIEAQTPFIIPSAKDDYVFRATEPVGTDRIKALVTSKPLSLTGVMAGSVGQQQQETAVQQNANRPSDAAQRRDQKNRPKDRSRGQQTERPEQQSGQQRPTQQTAGQQFRFHPTQRQQIQKLLMQYQHGENLKPEQLIETNLKELLGEFAQDEVAFYVGPQEANPTDK